MLDSILNSPHVWQGQKHSQRPSIPTGYDSLDKALPYGGWPMDGITEVISDPGCLELSLISPAIKHLQKSAMVTLLNPPWQLHAPYFERKGLSLDRLLCIETKAIHHQWAAEQTLKHKACSGLLYWPNKIPSFTAYRRLQIISNEFQRPVFIFLKSAPHNSPCSIRLRIQKRHPNYLQLILLKSHGSFGLPEIQIPISATTHFHYPPRT